MSLGTFLWSRSQGTAAATATGQTGSLNSAMISRAALDVNVKAFTAGTTPSIQFFVDRLGGDNIWYPIAQTAALTATGSVSLDISDAVADATAARHMVFTDQCRVRWVFAGAVVATSIDFSGSLYGRE